jgi:uncharacterized protein
VVSLAQPAQMGSSDALAVASGGAVGFSLGLMGGGGSMLAVPLLLYVVDIRDAHVAIGTSALAVSLNAFGNLIGHWRAGSVKWPPAATFAAAGIAGAAIGSSIGKLVAGDRLLFLFPARIPKNPPTGTKRCGLVPRR